MRSAWELLSCVFGGLEENGENIPVPTPLSDIKLEKNEQAVLIDVYMPTMRAQLHSEHPKNI